MKSFEPEQHFFENFKVYMVVLLFFITGILIGTITDITISPKQKEEILKYVMSFFDSQNKTVSNLYLLKMSVFGNAKLISLLWILGASVLGFPIVLLIIGYKGFSLGFCASFFIEKFKLKGFFFVFLTIFPQNIIAVPLFVVACVIALKFSLGMLGHYGLGVNSKRISGHTIPLGEYSLIFLLLFVFLCLSSLIEAYITPLIMNSSFIKL